MPVEAEHAFRTPGTSAGRKGGAAPGRPNSAAMNTRISRESGTMRSKPSWRSSAVERKMGESGACHDFYSLRAPAIASKRTYMRSAINSGAM
jgi:hypothetical protein